MIEVTLSYARTHIHKLLRKIEQGEVVHIKRRNKPVVALNAIVKKDSGKKISSIGECN